MDTPSRSRRTGRGWLYPAGLWALLLAITGCQSIPTANLASYKESFDSARSIGEEVALEYAILVKRNEAYQTQLRAAAQSTTGTLGVQFDPASAYQGQSNGDHVQIRLLAWEAAGRYNEALTAIAEGKSDAEIGGAVEGFVESLKSFPVDAVAEIGTEAVPYLGAIRPILGLIEKNLQAKRFRESVLEAHPLMERFFQSLLKDAETIWEMQSTLSEEDHDQAVSRAQSAARRFVAVARLVNRSDSDQVGQLVERMEKARQSLYNPDLIASMRDAAPVQSSRTDPTPEQLALLTRLTEEYESHLGMANAARQHLQEFAAFESRYLELLRATRQQMTALVDAVQQGPDAELTVQRLTQLVAAAREAYTVYKAGEE